MNSEQYAKQHTRIRIPKISNQMPWTRKAVKYLLSSGSPLKPEQQDKMKAELHANPAMGHMKKGFSGMANAKKVKT